MTSIKYETYLDFVRVKCFRDALIRFELGITARVANNNCPFCKAVEENEYHYLFHCEKYETVRPENCKHIKRHEENWKFTEIMLCEGLASTKQLA